VAVLPVGHVEQPEAPPKLYELIGHAVRSRAVTAARPRKCGRERRTLRPVVVARVVQAHDDRPGVSW